jgi:hypothetical protein
MSSPWAIEIEGILSEEPARLVRALTGAILGYGGWVLSRSAIDTGTVNMLFGSNAGPVWIFTAS